MVYLVRHHTLRINTAERPALTVTLYGLAHLVVDLASIGTLYTAVKTHQVPLEWVALLILFYDYLAFASQLFIGHALDRLGISGYAAAAGCCVTAAGLWLTGLSPVAAVAAVAAGNALFHVGGGTVCLRLRPGKAVWPGLFVAPGAVGLFLGKQIGGTEAFSPAMLTALLAAAGLIGVAAHAPKRDAAVFPQIRGFGLVAAALVLTVAIRSLVGFTVSYPWVAGWQQALLLTLAVFAGKALGGALGDRLGWRSVTVAGLLLSAPLLAFGKDIPALSVAGVLCFNLTMAITLAGLAAMLPGHEGLAFGLTTTAIVVGLTPAVIPGWAPVLGTPLGILVSILACAAALWAALGRLQPTAGRATPATTTKGGVSDAVP